ncbi:MAG: NupC/NupG family nucleoside CNT transporter [Planctomycetes bacterium]|nr:NupC/NupG family nucleoside CNT transporter [Planctomycetota bacterium]
MLGLLVMVGLMYAFSADRRAVRWRVVVWGLALQFIFALFVLHTSVGQAFFDGVNRGFMGVMKAAQEGAAFVFGPPGVTDDVPVGHVGPGGEFRQIGSTVARVGFQFAFRALPPIIFFSALMAIGYHLGVMQWIVRAFAKVMSVSMKTSGAETMSAAANIFVGQTEAPLMVRPYVNSMTNSELMAIMVGGFANTAGGVMLMYISMLQDRVPDIGAHLLTSSVLTGPASLMMAKLLLPETARPTTLDTPRPLTRDAASPLLDASRPVARQGRSRSRPGAAEPRGESRATAGDVRIELPRTDANLIDAAARGTQEGLGLALNVAAMLIVFIAMVALADLGLAWTSQHVFGAEQPWTLATIFGKLFWPLAWLMGVPLMDCAAVGNLLGVKTFLNELVAYKQLADTGGGLSDRSYLIASYALCGFANIGSIGIQIGGIGAMAPERRGDLARLGVKAMIAGSFATFSAACVVAILV